MCVIFLQIPAYLLKIKWARPKEGPEFSSIRLSICQHHLPFQTLTKAFIKAYLCLLIYEKLKCKSRLCQDLISELTVCKEGS